MNKDILFWASHSPCPLDGRTLSNHSAKKVRTCSTDQGSHGLLQVTVVSIINNFPIENATVRIVNASTPDSMIEELTTNSSGQTEQISLDAPPLDYSLTPNDNRPYSEYKIGRASCRERV